jgi:hypothetical protein
VNTCAKCKWWGAERRQNRDWPLGTCRRHSPTLWAPQTLENRDGSSISIARGEWGWTALDDWCGDFDHRAEHDA